MSNNLNASFNPSAKLRQLKGQYPFSLFVSLGLIALIGVGIVVHRGSSRRDEIKNPPAVAKSTIELPDLEMSELSQSQTRNSENVESQIRQLEQRLKELEKGISEPQTLMETFAVKLCEYHGGNNGDSKVNPCMEREYFQRQAKALAPHYELRIEKCLSAGKGNACFDPKTYLTPRIDAQTKTVQKADIATGICQIIFNPNRCK